MRNIGTSVWLIRVVKLLPYVATIIIFLFLYLPLSEAPIRGEHWALLYRYIENVSLEEKIHNISFFAFHGVKRPQLLAFFIPYIPFSIFGINFWGYAVFSYFLHFLCGAIIVAILKLIKTPNLYCSGAFAIFTLAFLCSDTINWSFFSYIQTSVLLILTSIYFLLRYELSNTNIFFTLQCLCIFLATFIYEATFMVFIAQLIYLCIYRRNLLLILTTCSHMFIVFLIVLLVFKGIPIEPGANHAFHPGIIYRTIIFLKNLIINSIGIGLMEVSINNIPALLNKLPDPLFTFRNTFMFSSVMLLIYISINNISAQNFRNRLIGRLSFYSILIFVLYVLCLSYGRVTPIESFLSNPYFDQQLRYYYLPLALTVIISFCYIFSCSIFSSSKIMQSAIVVAISMIAIGNSLNTYYFNQKVLQYNNESMNAKSFVESVMERNQIELSTKNFILYYTHLWRTKKISLKDQKKTDFIFNTVDHWGKAFFENEERLKGLRIPQNPS